MAALFTTQFADLLPGQSKKRKRPRKDINKPQQEPTRRSDRLCRQPTQNYDESVSMVSLDDPGSRLVNNNCSDNNSVQALRKGQKVWVIDVDQAEDEDNDCVWTIFECKIDSYVKGDWYLKFDNYEDAFVHHPTEIFSTRQAAQEALHKDPKYKEED